MGIVNHFKMIFNTLWEKARTINPNLPPKVLKLNIPNEEKVEDTAHKTQNVNENE